MLIYFIIGFNKYDGFGLYLSIFHLYTLYIIFYAFCLSIYNYGVKSLRKVKKKRGFVYNRQAMFTNIANFSAKIGSFAKIITGNILEQGWIMHTDSLIQACNIFYALCKSRFGKICNNANNNDDQVHILQGINPLNLKICANLDFSQY